jgi:hypothetical protein
MSVTAQIIKDSTRETVIKLTNYGITESAVTKVDASTLVGAIEGQSFHEIVITNISWSVSGSGVVTLLWDAGTPQPIVNLSGSGSLRYTGGEFIMIRNNASNPNGDIKLTTNNWGATVAYTIILTLSKLTNFDRGGVDSVG